MVKILDPKTVNFETNGGSRVASQTVYRDFPVKRPSDPVRSGYTFDAWYSDNEAFVNKWNFDTVPNADITLYANWNPETGTGSPGLAFTLISINGGTNNAYRVSRGTATGNIVIPAYHRENADSPYLPVTEIGTFAFADCANIESVTFAAGSQLETISYFAFSDCTSLTGIIIPASVTKIDGYAFKGCTNLKSIIIPANVTEIGILAFADCTSLASVTIGAGVATIGDNAFQDCTSLRNITIDTDKVTSYNSNPFNSSNNWGTIFPADELSVTFRKNVGGNAFNGSTSLKSVTIASGVTSIGQQAFINCTSLTSVTIAEGVTSIGEQAFDSCTNLTSITIPASVTFIGDHAFNYWVISQTINIRGHASLQSANDAWGAYWLTSCNATIKYWNGSSYQ
jgi:uncharacterized repeat protein (TIGR02543 family)